MASFTDVDSVSVHDRAKQVLGQYCAILTSRLVNNPYILPAQLRLLTVPSKEKSGFFFLFNTSFSDQSCSVKIAGYWLRSFFPFYRTQLRLGL